MISDARPRLREPVRERVERAARLERGWDGGGLRDNEWFSDLGRSTATSWNRRAARVGPVTGRAEAA